MRIARIETSNGPSHAVADATGWRHIADPFAAELVFTGGSTAFDEAVLLAPVDPRVLLGIAQNKGNNDHLLPIQAWYKSPHTVTGQNATIEIVRGVGQVNIEGELAVVIGRHASKLTPQNALDAVLGYTVANDVTNVDQVPIDEKNFQSKSGPNYTPLGPWIETEIADPESVPTEVAINDVVLAESGSFNLGSTVVETLVYVTSWLDLEAGDVVMTGAPRTFLPVQPGDRVDIRLEGIGTLSSTIV
ncbi:fumarylacetoacetate hydrolase family protein [Agreia sp. VKM Ac-1783]|uniref:fumarylacetoacetate hydrolase family protein n=1 Tax=Agreia sp. VKM Ac-1783 TaxID=1938889 RepID=UPI000A2AAB26|nr:fumarylacetoacetate hydrolase family protein [Agreia sp. VKM Ac-1783]SMQ68436.1 2-keto-4-pentenoate hydratase/2-oxohepta-3-ene-1,7-dioic acid hydratase (catechol pathway) [Agreia sp. VKM Ac-1783]